MVSIIPGYEYDIFISYRQKDNKGDRWVSDFVDNMKLKMEAKNQTEYERVIKSSKRTRC